jgi:hypothetical protein
VEDRNAVLSRDLVDKESQIKREKERIEALLKQLDGQHDFQKSFEQLQGLTTKILQKLDEHYSQHGEVIKSAQGDSQAT